MQAGNKITLDDSNGETLMEGPLTGYGRVKETHKGWRDVQMPAKMGIVTTSRDKG